MGKVVTFGEIMIRVHMKEHRRFRQSLPGVADLTFAGAEANVAVSIALMGGEAAFVTALPAHAIADACVGELRNLGVDTSEIARTERGRLGIYFVEAGANHRPSNVIYDRDYSSIALEPPESYDWRRIFSGASWFHFTGITPSLSKNAADISLEAVRKAKEMGLTVSCDLNFRKKLWRWESGMAPGALAARVMGDMLSHVDILTANEEDIQEVLGIKIDAVDTVTGTLDVEKYPDLAAMTADKFPSLGKIAFTLRESISASYNNWGAMLYDTASKKASFAPVVAGKYQPYSITSIVDRIGGGDSFSAALIYASMDDSLKDYALDFATAASCLCHSIHGDFNYSTRAEILALMKGSTSGRIVR
jgi:2-dehydro-3-deoxygluconokinase